jgi:hypothetical protein
MKQQQSGTQNEREDDFSRATKAQKTRGASTPEVSFQQCAGPSARVRNQVTRSPQLAAS